MSDVDVNAIDARSHNLAQTRSILRWITTMIAIMSVFAFATCDSRREYWAGFEEGARYCK